MLFVCLLLAFKFMREDGLGLKKRYSKIGGVKPERLLEMEKEFLSIIDYKLFV